MPETGLIDTLLLHLVVRTELDPITVDGDAGYLALKLRERNRPRNITIERQSK